MAVLNLSGCTTLRHPVLAGPRAMERVVLTGTSLSAEDLVADEHTVIVK